MILRADAVREKKIRESEGEALAITNVQNAKAEAVVKLNEANPSENVLKYRAIDSFPQVANGNATKIIIPSEIQSLAGLAAGFKGVVEDEQGAKKTAE